MNFTKDRFKQLCFFTITVFLMACLNTVPCFAESSSSKLDKALQTSDFLQDEAHDELARKTKIEFNFNDKKTDQKVVDEIVALLKEPTTYQYGKRGDTLTQLMHKYDKSITAVRGGADSGKALGCYVGNNNLHYDSIYTKTSLENAGYWAYDLHRFLQENNGWYKRLDGSRYINYSDKEKFARQWFTRLDKNFIALNATAQSVFLHDAIEDGMVIYWFYENHKHQPVFERPVMWLCWEIRGCEKRI